MIRTRPHVDKRPVGFSLGTDADRRKPMRRRILEVSGVLYGDAAAIRDLEAFLVEAVARARQA